MEIPDLDYIGDDEEVERIEATPCWHRLRKIVIMGDCPDNK